MSKESKIKIINPSQENAEEAVRTLLSWAGDDPNREGLKDTPARVARAYKDWFKGYGDDPMKYMQRTFQEVEGYDEMIVLRDISFESHCEHHMAPIIGKAHVGYLPNNKVVGISKQMVLIGTSIITEPLHPILLTLRKSLVLILQVRLVLQTQSQ